MLVDARRGVVIRIEDADSFFSSLEEKVEALAELEAPHPLAPRVAVATLKRYLADERHHIRLHDLLFDEVVRVEASTSLEAMPMDGEATIPALQARLRQYEATCETLVSLMATGAYWADTRQLSLFTRVLERLGNRWGEPRSGLVVLIEMLDYPATLALYGAGLGAVGGNRLDSLARLLGEVRIVRHGARMPLLHEIAPTSVVEHEIFRRPPEQGQLYTPVNDHLARVLREPLRDLIPNDDNFTETFDRFEYLLSIAYADLSGEVGERVWAPVGSYVWRQRHWRGEGALRNRIEAEAREAGDTWPFLHGPLFHGQVERFLEVKQALDAHVGGLPII
jgi:hypothetical protein